jgi:hypothetical protein
MLAENTVPLHEYILPKERIMNTIKLLVVEENGEREIQIPVRRVVNAGYTGRNQEAVRRHIEELQKEGIPSPESTPTAYEVISKLVYFDDEIEVIGRRTSGEAEFVLLCSGDEVYVGVGSDHTDRELEVASIIKSKQLCPNIMGDRVWKLSKVRTHWDEMILRSWVKDPNGEKTLYQESPLATMMTPDDLMAFVRGRVDDRRLEGLLIFSGTVPLIPESTNFGDYFEVELSHPRTKQKLSCKYSVKVLDYLMAS